MRCSGGERSKGEECYAKLAAVLKAYRDKLRRAYCSRSPTRLCEVDDQDESGWKRTLEINQSPQTEVGALGLTCYTGATIPPWMIVPADQDPKSQATMVV